MAGGRLRTARLGIVPYAEAERLQEKLAERVRRGDSPPTLLLLEHPPVVTLGLRAGGDDLLAPPEEFSRRGIEVVRCRRGGRAAYHGLGTLVAYPVSRLATAGVRAWIDALVQAVVDALRVLGVEGVPDRPLPGVRVGGEKVAFFGLRVSRGVSTHGLSLNVDGDLSPYALFAPCGLPGGRVTSLERILGRAPDPRTVEDALIAALGRRLGLDPFEAEAREVLGEAGPAPEDPAEADSPDRGAAAGRKPAWLRVRAGGGEAFRRTQATVRDGGLRTVCEEARCPNLGACWSRGAATFLLLGGTCARACAFCAVAAGRPAPVDPLEPARVAEAAAAMRLRHVVLTSVTRDDLPDGGARAWAETIRAVRGRLPGAVVEALLPDLRGDRAALGTVLSAGADVLGHNLETVPRLYAAVRPRARYERSLALLAAARAAGARTKTGFMLGLGERPDEVRALVADAAAAGVAVLTIGQYLRPTRRCLPVARWVPPDEFEAWRAEAEAAGIPRVVAGPLVRSSYLADRHVAP